MVTRTTKGDSVQEDSDKTSTESMRRDWGQLSDSKPPTRKQLALIDDYVEKLGEDLDFDEINGSISVAPTTQLEAHQQIHYLHVKFAQREMFG
jgi:hypothetical protein